MPLSCRCQTHALAWLKRRFAPAADKQPPVQTRSARGRVGSFRTAKTEAFSLAAPAAAILVLMNV
jgi:hypothetical protein